MADPVRTRDENIELLRRMMDVSVGKDIVVPVAFIDRCLPPRDKMTAPPNLAAVTDDELGALQRAMQGDWSHLLKLGISAWDPKFQALVYRLTLEIEELRFRGHGMGEA